MDSQTVKDTFIDFFTGRGHREIPSASLVSSDSDGVLFTIAGMQPLTENLTGTPHPSGRRLVNSQRCLRTVDIDEVGDDAHLTYFEMLGCWSLGDYFKRESLRWTLELLVDRYGLEPGRLCVTVFEDDAESARIWRELGMPAERIFRYGADENWWSLGGPGPCGPDSEVFYFTGSGRVEGEPSSDARWVEVGNNVFMEFDGDAEGRLTRLPQRNVDIGCGLERLTCVVGGHRSVYDTDLLAPVVERVRRVSRHRDVRSERVVADHLRASVMLIGDGVEPSNTGRGYVLRRLIRRSIRHGRLLGVSGPLCEPLGEMLLGHLTASQPQLRGQEPRVLEVLAREERSFARSLTRGLRELDRTLQSGGTFDGRLLHRLFDTYGLPPEITVEELDRQGAAPGAGWQQEYERSVAEHRERSRQR